MGDAVGLLVSRINILSRNNKEKDLLSLLYILFFVLFGFILFSSLAGDFYRLLYPSFKNAMMNVYSSFEAFINPQDNFRTYQIEAVPTYSFNEIRLLGKWLIFFVVSMSIKWIFRKSNLKNELIYLVSSIIVMVIVYKAYYYGLLVFFITLLIIVIIPVGSGKYFKVLENLNYLIEIGRNHFGDYPVRLDNKDLSKKLFLIAMCWFFITIGLINVMVIPTLPAFVLVSSLTLLIYLNEENENKIYGLLKKVVVFILFFAIALYANASVEADIAKVFVLFITLFFSIDRIFSLSKEATKLIKAESILYYVEDTDIPAKELISEVIDIKYINEKITELELVKQLLLRYRLDSETEFWELTEIYKKYDYVYYLQLVKSLEYFYKHKGGELENPRKLKEKLTKIIVLENQKIVPVFIFLEYADVLYFLGEFEEAIDYYMNYFAYADNNQKINLYNSYIQEQREEEAERLKQNFM